jgi:hypothetical protein
LCVATLRGAAILNALLVAVVAGLAERLEIIRSPEKLHVAAVRDHMVYHLGQGNPSPLLAVNAQWVLSEKVCSR